MSKQLQVSFPNQNVTKYVDEGTIVSNLLKQENLPVDFPCNGQGTCGKCRVKIIGELSPPTQSELKHLDASELSAGVRLACQARLMGPLTIEISNDSKKNSSILSEGYFHLDHPDPGWGRITIANPSVVTWEQIAGNLPTGLNPTLSFLQKIAQLQVKSEPLVVERLYDRLIGVDYSGNLPPRYAVAVDIGTTTVAAYLVDLENLKILRTASAYNPQRDYGADLISRIGLAGNEEGLAKLHRLIIDQINKLVDELTGGGEISAENIIQMNLVGNSCMIHLLLKVNPASLGKVPFEPVFKDLIQTTPLETGLKMNQDGLVFLLPGIGGFVGADISAGVLACELKPEKTELFIDIGTNGEVVLTGKGRMMACSTAAGPAFEGASISCGMLAKPGAISDFQLTDQGFVLTTIGNEEAQGICGTGLVRIMTELVKRGIITETGRFADDLDLPNYNREQKRYYLVEREENPIYLSQADIRQFQLAKGAIRTGMELLMKRLGIKATDLETVYLAGAFGTYLNPQDAISLGLLPPVPLEKIKTVGNTAGMGAVISILSRSALEDLCLLTATIEHVELANDPRFTEVFTEAMLF